MTTAKPVIKLPPKRKPSLARTPSNNSSSTTHHSAYDSPELKDCLVSDTLFLSKLPANVRENDIRTLLQHCMPIEIVLDRENNCGQLRFSHRRYADRAYSLYNGFTFTNNAKLELQMYQEKRLDRTASAVLLKVNGLPDYFDDNKLYDVFRSFGPLNLCKCVMKDGAFRGTAFVQFFFPHNSDDAEAQLNDQLLDGHKLSVVPFMPKRPHASQQQIPQSPPPQQQPQQQHRQPQQQKREESSEETAQSVDIMNLYVKNLDPHITSEELKQAFSKFGRIISARVMSNPATQHSKGYGFVSYGKSEEAAAALQTMNGTMLGSRPLAVAYHEPRKGRNNNTNNTINNTNNNHHHHPHHHANNINNNSAPIHSHHYQHQNNTNKHVNENGYHHSNYNHFNGNVTQSQQQQPYYIPDQRSMNLPSNTPINGLGIDNVDELGINMNLRDLSIGQKPVSMHPATINLPPRKISDAPHHINSSPGSGTSTGRSLVSLASGLSIQQGPPQQQHASAINFGHNGRPTLRRRGSLESVMTESSANVQRIKLEGAVRQCGYQGKVASDIVDMLLTLKRKERSLCLFNHDFLRDKVELALEALNTCNESDSEDENENEEGLDMDYAMRGSRAISNRQSTMIAMPSPPQQPYCNTSMPSIQREHNISPPFVQPIRESKAIPIIAPPPPSSTQKTLQPTTTTTTTTTKPASLTQENLMNNQRATETTVPAPVDAVIVKTATSTVATPPTNSTPVAQAASGQKSRRKEIEQLLFSIEGKPIHEKKQLLGDKLFPLVKATGTRQAPKVTIYLLDTVDLRDLANIMYDTPSLKARVEEAFDSLQQQQ
ncbi:hypothetical protein BD560DRAFT_403764 [Blakeslea trispora]|nr:hypothetical protein BD560DRAFT_403764 [Blakeslea trispora]